MAKLKFTDAKGQEKIANVNEEPTTIGSETSILYNYKDGQLDTTTPVYPKTIKSRLFEDDGKTPVKFDSGLPIIDLGIVEYLTQNPVITQEQYNKIDELNGKCYIKILLDADLGAKLDYYYALNNVIKSETDEIVGYIFYSFNSLLGSDIFQLQVSKDLSTKIEKYPLGEKIKQATETELGGVKAINKTEDMTQPIGIDTSTGFLYTKAGGGGGNESFNVLVFPVGTTTLTDEVYNSIIADPTHTIIKIDKSRQDEEATLDAFIYLYFNTFSDSNIPVYNYQATDINFSSLSFKRTNIQNVEYVARISYNKQENKKQIIIKEEKYLLLPVPIDSSTGKPIMAGNYTLQLNVVSDFDTEYTFTWIPVQ